jgi:hypothetical protein
MFASKHKEVGFHISQALTGHGCFQSYLHKRKRADHPRCLHCGWLDDTADHILFHCSQWVVLRQEAERVIGRTLRPVDIPDILLDPEKALLPIDARAVRRLRDTVEYQRRTFKMVEAIMGEKEELERER